MPHIRTCRPSACPLLIVGWLLTGTTGSAAEASPVEVEVRLADNSALKVRLLDDKLDLETPYGTLRIPAREVVRIDLSPRLTPTEEREIEAAVTALTGPDTRKRDAAKTALLRYGPKAMPAVVRAAADGPGIKRYAEELLVELRTEGEGDDKPTGLDVVETGHSKIAGRLTMPSFKVRTAVFGDKPLRVADVRWVRSAKYEVEQPLGEVLPGPQSLMNYQGDFNKTYLFRVTGGVGGGVWGTGTYTLDSYLPAAAVHAGVVQMGQTGVVKVKIIPSPPMYTGSSRNGIDTTNFNAFPPGAFEFVPIKKK